MGGEIVTHGVSVAAKGAELFDLLIAVTSGAPIRSEDPGYGGAEFFPWRIGTVM
ncbi:MAG: hypothetical protein ACXIU8_02110 [Alkalilacustris sp.]